MAIYTSAASHPCSAFKMKGTIAWLRRLAFIAAFVGQCISALSSANKREESSDAQDQSHSIKMDLWSRGAFDLDLSPVELEMLSLAAPMRLGPVRMARYDVAVSDKIRTNECLELDCDAMLNPLKIRGGSTSLSYAGRLEEKLSELSIKLGPDFAGAIERNKREHAEDCATSCESFYCAENNDAQQGTAWAEEHSNTTFRSYSFGSVPPEDFSEVFGYPLDLIKVTQGAPLFSADEAATVVNTAENEGLSQNQYESGKYRLGGDWLLNLPKTRAWFNEKLRTSFFPLLSYLFPEIISSPAVLRAHSVSLLKYNSSHPRTDVHIDNGILAMTLAMTPKDRYVGGGTFFEHFGVSNVLQMDVGHGTFRPGSVRHGGHKVLEGTRYILGAFLLIEDKPEHVRRLKNRGSDLRKAGDLEGAAKHFEWALAINPKCTTCLKDWAEILLAEKRFVEAEEKIRAALELLEHQDSDALFTLGILLSEQGKDEESLKAYQQSLELNAEDAELCYNLGIKLGAKGDTKGEMNMYAKATNVDPQMGGAWVNWGTALAEAGNLDDAEMMFVKALECGPDVRPKALMNLALVHNTRANEYAQGGDLPSAKASALKASNLLDQAKPLLDELASDAAGADADSQRYITQFKPLRLQVHRLYGQILAGAGEYAACEEEFKRAAETYPDIPGVWDMLGRILELQGKTAEAAECKAKVTELTGR